MPITFTRVLSLYALLQASFQSFKALHRAQQYSQLLDQHSRSRKKNPDLPQLDEDAIFRTLDQNEILPLLHFWSVMAVIHLYDSYFEIFVDWIPFYFLVKTLLMMWILIPKTKGATVFFELVLIPQVDKHMKRMEETWFPLMRKQIVNLTFRIFSQTLDRTLDVVSTNELQSLDRSVNLLTRTVTREGYRRKREESILALQVAVPEEKQRVALLDDILREFVLAEDSFANWTELRMEKGDHAGEVRLRFGSDFDTSEDEEWSLDQDLFADAEWIYPKEE